MFGQARPPVPDPRFAIDIPSFDGQPVLLGQFVAGRSVRSLRGYHHVLTEEPLDAARAIYGNAG
jgi:hypothetical protein